MVPKFTTDREFSIAMTDLANRFVGPIYELKLQKRFDAPSFIIIYSLKPPQVRKTYYTVYYIHTNVSQIRNITVYVLKAGQ